MQTLFTIGETKAMVVAAVAVLVSLAVCWTWRSIRDKWRRLGAFGKFAAIAVFCALVWRGGAKNEGGDRGVDSPAESEMRLSRSDQVAFAQSANPEGAARGREAQSSSRFGEDRSSGSGGLYSVVPVSGDIDPGGGSTNALPVVSNLTFAAIWRGSNATELVVAWPPDSPPLDSTAYVYSATNLVEWLWEKRLSVDVAAFASNAVVCVEDDMISTNATPKTAFFGLGDAEDSDCDGSSDADEWFVYGTNPGEPDTDGDGFCDGWEIAHTSLGYDPHVYNSTNALSMYEDYDNDGLSNLHEQMLGTNPMVPDTDGDGILDGLEVPVAVLQAQFDQLMALYQNPTRSYPSASWYVLPVLDNCTNPLSSNNTAFATAAFYFGDPSSSHSEKYALRVTPVAGSSAGATPAPIVLLNPLYGVCNVFLSFLPKGWSYDATFEHVSTDANLEGNPDPDYGLLGAAGSAAVVFSDLDGLFGVSSVTNGEFEGEGKTASITAYGVMDVAICKTNETGWTELEESRVVLDDESLIVKVEIAPQLNSLAQCCAMFGNNLTLKTSATCPSGASVPLASCATAENEDGKTKIIAVLSNAQLKSQGLLPANANDGVDEKSWMDMVQYPGQNYADSEAFSALNYQFRGKATSDTTQNMESTPPNSQPSESFFQAAGCEILTAGYGGLESPKRQIMNQADCFYFSGHGLHSNNTLQEMFSPSNAASYWNRDLDCVIISGCSVLDINDYNGHYDDEEHDYSPGEAWEQTGPSTMLGYNYTAPGDAGGAPARIVQSWLANRGTMGDVGAWMKANEDNRAWNACAIVKDVKYVYFKSYMFDKFHKKQEIPKGNW